MRTRVLKTMIEGLVLLALCVCGPGIAGAQDATSKSRAGKPVVPASNEPPRPAGMSPATAIAIAPDKLYVGDTLAIRFMETIEIPDPRAAEPASKGSGLVRTFYQRADLSGEYHVRPDGQVNLPVLGAVPAADMTLAAFEDALRARLETAIERKVQVSIGITRREPIYVVGGVRNAGSFPYRSGMLAIHAVALAGGVEKSISDFDRAMQRVRHDDLAEKARADLKRLLALKARLEAERDGQQAVKTPRRLVDLVGNTSANEAVEAEQQQMRARVRGRLAHVKTLQSEIDAKRQELALLKSRAEKFVSQVDSRRARAQNMQRLSQRADTTNDRVLSLQRDLLDAEAQQSDYAIAVMNAELRLQMRVNDLAKFQLDHDSNVEAELTKAVVAIAEAEQALATNRAMTALFSGSGQQAMSPRLTVIRKRAGQPVTETVTQTSFLEPGDLLRVDLNGDDTTATQPLR